MIVFIRTCLLPTVDAERVVVVVRWRTVTPHVLIQAEVCDVFKESLALPAGELGHFRVLLLFFQRNMLQRIFHNGAT